MVSAMKSIILAILIFGAFASKNTESKYTDLQHALQDGDEKTAHNLLNHFVEKEKEKLIEYLMEEDHCGDNFQTFLHEASKNGKEKIVKLILNTFTDEKKEKLIEYLMKENKSKYTALHFAANRQKEIVKLLLSAFEDDKEKLIEFLMKKNQEEKTALDIALQNGDEEIVNLLWNELEKEQKIQYLMKEDKYKDTVLHNASYQGHTKIVKLLLSVFTSEEENDKKIKYVMKKNNSKETALHLALYSQKRNVEIITLLMNALSKEDGNNTEIIEYLIKQNGQKESPLQIALSKKDRKCFVHLLLNPIKFNGQDKYKLIQYFMQGNKYGNTALQEASKAGNENIVKSLLNSFGKNQNEKFMEYLMAKNLSGRTALQLVPDNKIKLSKLLLHELINVQNQIIFRKLQFISHTDAQKMSPFWSVFRDFSARHMILSFLMTDYDVYNYHELNIFEDNNVISMKKKQLKAQTQLSECDDEIFILHDDIIAKQYTKENTNIVLHFKDGEERHWGFNLVWKNDSYVVEEVIKDGQAEIFGVQIGWILKIVNDTFVTGLNRKAIVNELNRQKPSAIVFRK